MYNLIFGARLTIVNEVVNGVGNVGKVYIVAKNSKSNHICHNRILGGGVDYLITCSSLLIMKGYSLASTQKKPLNFNKQYLNCKFQKDDDNGLNARGADARQRNLQRKWASLESRAADRKEGKDLPTRKQRIKNKLEGKTFGDNGPAEKILKLSTQFVSDDTDLGGIVEQQFSNFSHRMGIIGLHTCGNLSPSSLKIFLASKSAKFICNVGCCYHALDEEFYTNPHLPVTTGNAGTEAIVPGRAGLRERCLFLFMLNTIVDQKLQLIIQIWQSGL